MKKERKNGYYWVYLNNLKNFSHYGWEVAKWDGICFWYEGEPYDEDCFKIIDEKEIIRNV